MVRTGFGPCKVPSNFAACPRWLSQKRTFPLLCPCFGAWLELSAIALEWSWQNLCIQSAFPKVPRNALCGALPIPCHAAVATEPAGRKHCVPELRRRHAIWFLPSHLICSQPIWRVVSAPQTPLAVFGRCGPLAFLLQAAAVASLQASWRL